MLPQQENTTDYTGILFALFLISVASTSNFSTVYILKWTCRNEEYHLFFSDSHTYLYLECTNITIIELFVLKVYINLCSEFITLFIV